MNQETVQAPQETTRAASQQRAETAIRSLYSDGQTQGFKDVELFSRWVSEKWVSGERLLFAAILQRAALDVILFSDSWDLTKRRIGDSARRWIFSDKKDHFTSFKNVCEVVNLDPGWVRTRVQELVEANRKETLAVSEADPSSNDRE